MKAKPASANDTDVCPAYYFVIIENCRVGTAVSCPRGEGFSGGMSGCVVGGVGCFRVGKRWGRLPTLPVYPSTRLPVSSD